MILSELFTAIIRREEFGGIIFIPSRNAQIAINYDLYQIIQIIVAHKSLEENIVRSIADKYQSGVDDARKILEVCLKMIAENLDSYTENSDQPSDWDSNSDNPVAIKLSAPLMLIIEVTNFCNQNCNFCCLAEETKAANISLMPDEMIRGIIDDSRELGVFKIQFMGGEPLCRDGFSEIIKYTSENGIYVSFTTNGLLLGKIVNDLRQVKRLLPIQVSIHGDFESSQRYRISPGELKTTIEGCNLLAEKGISFGVKAVISRLNYKKVFDLICSLDNLGAKTVTLLHLLPVGRGKEIEESSRFSENEINEIIEQIKTARRAVKNIHIDHRPFLNVYFPKKPKTDLDKFLNCPAGNSDLRIRYDGKILQCSSLRLPIDDICVGGLKKVWSSLRAKMQQCPYECKQVFQCIQSY